MEDEPVVLHRVFNASVSKVWTALTYKNEMKKWYFDLRGFRPEVGFKFEFKGGPEDGKQYTHLCEITEAIPEKKLTYSWRYDGHEGNSFVTFELSPQADKTLLTLTHRALGSFPQNNPDFAAKNFYEGWNHIINTSLKDFLEE